MIRWCTIYTEFECFILIMLMLGFLRYMNHSLNESSAGGWWRSGKYVQLGESDTFKRLPRILSAPKGIYEF